MTWTGENVSKALNVQITDAADGQVPLKALVGLALRHNPKRAHLLVSNVLGKHVPTDPKLVLAAGHLLGLMVANELAHEAYTEEVRDMTALLTAVLHDETDLNELTGSLNTLTVTEPVTVVGYAETATALGASVAAKLNAPYLHSTRYPDADAKFYGAFEESHSHATSHHLTPTDPGMLDQTAPLVLVDDEMTTGSTAINTIRMLHTRQPHRTYIIAALIDLRTEADQKRMTQVATELGTTITVVALGKGQISLPDEIVVKAETYMLSHEATEAKPQENLNTKVYRQGYTQPQQPLKNGVQSFAEYDRTATNILANLPRFDDERVLVLGIEEDMYLPLLVASKLQASIIQFSTTTRSPVFPLNEPGYAIRDRISYQVPEIQDDTSERFAYNLDYDYDRILIITTPDVDRQLATTGGLYQQLIARTKNMTVLTATDLPAPLTGPAFGSYPADDVQWLLKDLSDVKLEAPIEDREEAIQNGGAHYSESLPIEYQPTAEYQQLFRDSLDQNAFKLATAVTTVSELILERRTQPVLVSLARAGVPIGVLIKRYLKTVHNIDAPHYAVSIVRGKGIDYNAMRYLTTHHHPEDIIFIDGWTGKGAIVKELVAALTKFQTDTGIHIPSDLAVLADPGHCVELYGTRDDYLIPSACLNSTVSGLISRTVLRPDLMTENDYHGAKFYKEFADIDQSNHFINTVTAEFAATSANAAELVAAHHREYTTPDFSGWQEIEQLSETYGINNVNLVKPGVGETTRVLLRRVPWRILVREDQYDNLEHVRLLAEARGVEIVKVTDLTYSCVGLIHPKYTKGATGFDGTKA